MAAVLSPPSVHPILIQGLEALDKVGWLSERHVCFSLFCATAAKVRRDEAHQCCCLLAGCVLFFCAEPDFKCVLLACVGVLPESADGESARCHCG